MTDKEKAAEEKYPYLNDNKYSIIQHQITNAQQKLLRETFLAGCAYQEQVDREVIESLINDIRYIAKNPLLLNTTDLQESLIEVLNNYHKATDQAV